jgi:3-hydroxybutyryl-CoA dehydratase
MATPKLDNETLPVITKVVTQAKINQFESCGILDRENIHNNPELARQRLGTSFPIASGRMSVAFASEALRKFFGSQVFNHTGSVNLKFLRPVKDGDTVTVHGMVNSRQKVENGTLVTVDIYCENQNGDKTAVGQGGAVIP